MRKFYESECELSDHDPAEGVIFIVVGVHLKLFVHIIVRNC